MSRRVRPYLSLAASILVVGCTSNPVATSGASTTGLLGIEVSSGGQVTHLDPASDHYELATLSTLGNLKVRVTTATGSVASISGVTLTSGQWTPLPVTNLDKGAAIPIDVKNVSGAAHTYQIATLPADFPDYKVTANNPSRGILCFTANASDGKSPSYVFVTDESGHPLFYRKTPGMAFNLQRFTAPDGSVRYAYLQVEGEQLSGVGTFRGSIQLLDGSFNPIKSLMLLPTGDHPALRAELHDFVYINDNDFILEAYEPKNVSNIPSLQGTSSNVTASIIEEVRDGRVVFDWDSSNYPEFYANASDGNDYTDTAQSDADYMHLNSICVDPQDNNLLVSLRHQDQVIKLDRNTGGIVWRLGGKDSDFALTSTQKFSHQHHVRMAADGTLTMFDNGNSTLTTRLLSFKLDETGKTVTSFNALTPETRFSSAMGSYQILDSDHSFVGWGFHNPGLSDALEFTKEGTKTFELTFANPTYLAYRVLKYPD